jgi:hypothetical protein
MMGYILFLFTYNVVNKKNNKKYLLGKKFSYNYYNHKIEYSIK